MVRGLLEVLEKEEGEKKEKMKTVCVMRRIVKMWWEDMGEEEQSEWREGVLNGMSENSESREVVEVMAEVVGEMVARDGIGIWVEPLREFKGWVESTFEEDTHL